MGVPKQRHTKSRRNKRRQHQYIEGMASVLCPKCSQPVLPHTLCQNCGYYKGREIIDVLAKLTKKEKKQKEKELKAKGEEKTPQEGMSWEDLSKK